MSLRCVSIDDGNDNSPAQIQPWQALGYTAVNDK